MLYLNCAYATIIIIIIIIISITAVIYLSIHLLCCYLYQLTGPAIDIFNNIQSGNAGIL